MLSSLLLFWFQAARNRLEEIFLTQASTKERRRCSLSSARPTGRPAEGTTLGSRYQTTPAALLNLPPGHLPSCTKPSTRIITAVPYHDTVLDLRAAHLLCCAAPSESSSLCRLDLLLSTSISPLVAALLLRILFLCFPPLDHFGPSV
ncbi:hypothetical protein HDV57DRAFT_198408 [Trichoderma longibrachiatum]